MNTIIQKKEDGMNQLKHIDNFEEREKRLIFNP